MMIRSTLFLVTGLLASGCAHSTIAGTTIRDTETNRQIFHVIQQVQTALEERDDGKLLELVSESYFEDMGTSTQDDDYGYHELKNEILAITFAHAEEMHVSFELHDIVVEGERAFADLRYQSRAKVEMPTRSFWDSHKDFNRIVFAREDGSWRIVSGL